jgi:hypothetical protein
MLAILLVGCSCHQSCLFALHTASLSLSGAVRCMETLARHLFGFLQLETGQGNNQGTKQVQYNARFPQPYQESASDSNLY